MKNTINIPPAARQETPNPTKIIIFFLDTKKNSGGAYEELLYMIEKIDKINKNQIDIVIISTSKNVSQVFDKKNFEAYYFSMNTFERYIGFLRNHGSLARRLKKYFFLLT